MGSRAKERPNTKQGADSEKYTPTQGRTAYDYNRFLVGFSLISIKYFYCITVLPSVLLHHVLTTDFLVIRYIFFYYFIFNLPVSLCFGCSPYKTTSLLLLILVGICCLDIL